MQAPRKREQACRRGHIIGQVALESWGLQTGITGQQSRPTWADLTGNRLAKERLEAFQKAIGVALTYGKAEFRALVVPLTACMSRDATLSL